MSTNAPDSKSNLLKHYYTSYDYSDVKSYITNYKYYNYYKCFRFKTYKQMITGKPIFQPRVRTTTTYAYTCMNIVIGLTVETMIEPGSRAMLAKIARDHREKVKIHLLAKKVE